MQDARQNRYGRAVQAYRERLNWSQQHLATLLGYDSISIISNIELGHNLPPLDKAKAIAQVFGTTIDAMWEFEGRISLPAAAVPGEREVLLVPSSRGTIHLRGWSLEETLQLLRGLKEVGVLFDSATLHDPPSGEGGRPDANGALSADAS